MTALGEEPPKEPLSLRLSNLYGEQGKDKQIQGHITEHCCHCPAFEAGIHGSSTQCADQLCGYIFWHYAHFLQKHKRPVLNSVPCSECNSCARLYRWMVVHSSECLRLQLQCCIPLCTQMKQSQHLLNLSRDDHSFIGHIESRTRQDTSPQPLNSLPTLAPQHNYTGDQSRQLHTAIRDGTPLSQHPQYGDILTQNVLPQKLVNGTGYSSHTTTLKNEGVLYSSQGGRQMMPLNHHHSQSYTNMRSSDSNSSGLIVRGADTRNSVESMYDQRQTQQWAAGDFNQVMSSSAGSSQQWATGKFNQAMSSSAGSRVYNHQSSSTSSGYGTASRYSVVSMLSREQSLGEIPPVHVCENALQVNSTPHRKISAPPNYNSSHPRTKKMQNQQSHSLTNLTQNIPEYPYDNEINEYHESEECIGHPSLQRQDTGHATKVVFAGLEDSIDGEQYQSVMGSKRKMPKQNAVDEESAPSPPVTKRPLQREQSDVSGKDKFVLGNSESRTGSNSLTREQYDSIFQFQEQRGILADQETRERVLGKQRKQAILAEKQQTRRGTMTSDIPSDFDTESGSSPLISSEFSDPEDLTDQEEEKKAAQTESKMTVEEQIRMIQAMKAGKVMSLPVHLPEVHRERMKPKKQHIMTNMVQSPSLPPEMSTYAPSDRPLHSLPQGDGHNYLTYNNSSSSMSEGTSTLENERLSNNTLKEEENCYGGSTRFSVGSCGGPATHSSTDGSTLTGGSFEGKFTSLRLPGSTSSERNEDVLGMVNSPSLPASQSSLTQSPMQGELQRVLPGTSPMDMNQSDLERSSYYREEIQSMESDARGSLSPAHAPPTFQPSRLYRLPSSQVQQMCQRVDDVKEKYQDELLRIRHKEQLMRQGAPDIPLEEQRRPLPGYRISVDKHHDSNTLYRGPFSRDCPESSYPELERHYYKKTLQQPFPESEEEIAQDIERRFLLRNYLLGKFHSRNAYREGVHWHRKTQLGKGGQAQCYSIQDVKTQMIMALKEEKEDHKTLDEAFVCMKLSYLSNTSQNIVDYYCAALLPKEHNLRRMSLIQVFMEMVPACLHAYLHDNGPFGIEDLHHFGYQLFNALEYLHSTLRIIHCDVKPANLLLDYTAQRLKLTDFGFAQILDQYSSEVQSDENAGTLSYNPPEHYREKCCSFALDIWQAGCTLLTMATGRRPWRHLFMDIVRKDKPMAYIQALRRGQANLIGQQSGGHMYPAFLDESLKKLLYGCLCHNPQSRLSAQDCVYHLVMAGTPHMNEQHRSTIVDAFGHWRSPPPVFSSYNQDTHFVDVYLDTTRLATIDDSNYTLCAGWLGSVPYRQGMTFEQLEKEILPQHFSVMQHLSPFSLRFCENSPQALFMKATDHPVNLTFEPAIPQSLVDRTKAVVISVS